MAHWGEPHRCPRCGFERAHAPCKVCFPAEFERARLRHLAEEDAGPGRRWCRVHNAEDRCPADWGWHAETALRDAVDALEEQRQLSWSDAMARLRRRYAGP